MASGGHSSFSDVLHQTSMIAERHSEASSWKHLAREVECCAYCVVRLSCFEGVVFSSLSVWLVCRVFVKMVGVRWMVRMGLCAYSLFQSSNFKPFHSKPQPSSTSWQTFLKQLTTSAPPNLHKLKTAKRAENQPIQTHLQKRKKQTEVLMSVAQQAKSSSFKWFTSQQHSTPSNPTSKSDHIARAIPELALAFFKSQMNNTLDPQSECVARAGGASSFGVPALPPPAISGAVSTEVGSLIKALAVLKLKSPPVGFQMILSATPPLKVMPSPKALS
nr:hypothetical protein Iba_chr13dCG11660 [Ipomoea batatas]